MKELSRALLAYVEETEPSAADVDRVRWKLRESLAGEGDLRRLLEELPEPPAGAVQRVRRRLARPVRWRIPWAGLGLAGAAAAAALLVLFGEREPEVLDRSLRSPAVMSALDLGDVRFSWRGTGELRGVPGDLAVSWEEGLLSVEVLPERDVELVVTTPEARVAVTGTAFSVVRDAAGTSVRVERGRVALACEAGEERELAQGQGELCAVPSLASSSAAPASDVGPDGLVVAQADAPGSDRDPELAAATSAPSPLPVEERPAAPVAASEQAPVEPSDEPRPAIPEGVTRVEVVTPDLSKRDGEPVETREVHLRYAVGTVQVTGEATAVWLVSGEHGTRLPGEVPRGRYQVRANFPGKLGVTAGWIEVEPGGYVSLECSQRSGRCWEQ